MNNKVDILIIHRMTYNQKYSEKQFIGRGNYGKVYLVVENKTLQFYVAKKISLEGMQFLQIDKTMRQIEIHRQLQHGNIIAFKQYFLQDDILIILMEYCQYGDLSVYINNMKKKGQLFQEELIMNLFIQLVQGIIYLHQHKIIHRDIKPQNIFINEQGVLKLADFGISKAMEQTQEKAMTLIGTPYYLSPEACKNQGFTTKSDIWSLGCVLYELCTLKHAFQGGNVLSLANKITHDKVQHISGKYPKSMFALIESLLEKEPVDRPTAKQILGNGYVKKYLNTFGEQQYEEQKPLEQNNLREYDNQFMPNIQKQYTNQFLEDEHFHPKPVTLASSSCSKTTLSNRSNHEEEISPRKSGANSLKQKCKKKMGDKLFTQMYSMMRKMKRQGSSEIEIETKVRKQYANKGEFDLAMDVAQLIYIEDNP